MIFYVNGEYVPREKAAISPEDRGFLFGDAIYEVARFFRGRGFHLEEHIARMQEGLAALRIAAEASFYPEVARELLRRNALAEADAIVYAQVSRGAAPRTHAFPPDGTRPTIFAFARASDPPPPPGGGRAILAPDERWGRCDIKTVMLLPNVLAAQRAREAGALDAILVRDGVAIEGTRSNLFAVIGGVIRTAPNGPRILPGVTRGATLATARALDLPTEERSIAVEEMFAASEVFFASTTLWTHSIVEVDGRVIGDGKPGPVARRLKEALLGQFRGS
jgi:D-alanine transaminase